MIRPDGVQLHLFLLLLLPLSFWLKATQLSSENQMKWEDVLYETSGGIMVKPFCYLRDFQFRKGRGTLIKSLMS